MTKSFDDAVSKHKNNLIESLSQFNEGHRVRGLLMDIESNKSNYEYYFNAGQQSKQAEVDGLQMKLSEDSRVLHNVIDIERKKCEELQKRIDRVAHILTYTNHASTPLCNELREILKGNTNEH